MAGIYIAIESLHGSVYRLPKFRSDREIFISEK